MKVSIITVSLNSERFIKEAIQSVNNQSYSDIEHIFVDGSSQDQTVNIINSNAIRNIKVLSEPDDGIYNAMNKGLALSTGDIICFLNSDDFFIDDLVLEKVVAVFEQRNVDIVYSGITYINSNYKVISEWVPDEFFFGSFSKSWHPPHPGFFARKVCYEKAGSFDLNFNIAADFELMFRFFEVYKFSSAPLSRSIVNMRNDGFSSSFRSRLQGLLDIKKTFQKHENNTVFILLIFRRYIKKLKRIVFKN